MNYKKPFKSMSVALQMKCCGFGERETAPDPQERKWKILKERAVKKGKEPEYDENDLNYLREKRVGGLLRTTRR